MGDEQKLSPDEQIALARDQFENATDFTVAVEEEFALVDPDSLDLTNRFEEVQAAAPGTPLEEHLVGELIASEVEIRTGRQESFADIPDTMAERRSQLQTLIEPMGLLLGATGTHPWADWKNQRIIDTPHYRRNDELLRYVVWRNNTFGLHVHVAIRGADRATAVLDAMRNYLPEILALSASSPFVEGVNSGLHSARTQIFTKSFPRCGIPDAFGSWAAYSDYIGFLVRSKSIEEFTQVWWSVRPHHSYGTVEMRICDAQASGDDSTTLAALITSCVAQAAMDHDEGMPFDDPPPRMIEENLWRAIRYGLDGKLIDLERAEEYPAAAARDRLLAWTAPARTALGIDVALPEENGAQRQKRMLADGAAIEDVYAAEVALTQRTYAAEEVAT